MTADPPSPSRRFLFIGSSPRSGTSALTTLLNAHPQIAVGMERYARIWPKQAVTPGHFQPEVFFARHDFDAGRNLDKQFDVLGFRENFATATYVGDKYPFITAYLPYLFSTFVPATLVYILRHPVAVCRSAQARFENPADTGFNMDAAAVLKRWNRSLTEVQAAIAQERHVIVVSYEKLFPSRLAIERLFGALGLSVADANQRRIAMTLQRASTLATRQNPSEDWMNRLVAEKADLAAYRRLTEETCILRDLVSDGTAAEEGASTTAPRA